MRCRPAACSTPRRISRPRRPAPDCARSTERPYLRNLAALVLLSTMGATLVDYVFKAQAVEAVGRGDALLRFFAIYYAATGLLAFAHPDLRRAGRSLAKLGLALTTSTPSLAILAWAASAQSPFPGRLERRRRQRRRIGASAARCSAPATKSSTRRCRAMKSAPRSPSSTSASIGSGDALGGGLISLVILLPLHDPLQRDDGGSLSSAARSRCSSRGSLNRGYIADARAQHADPRGRADLSDVEDLTTRTAMLKTPAADTLSDAAGDRRRALAETRHPDRRPRASAHPRAPVAQPRPRRCACSREEEGLPPRSFPHVIPLLAWDAVAEEAVRALRKAAEDRIGALADALLDPNQPFAVRRRLARVFSICVSQRAVDGLLLALDDTRFEVRFQCGRSLASILAKNQLVADRSGAHLRDRPPRGRRSAAGLGEPPAARCRWATSGRRSWTTSSRTAPARAWRTSSSCCRWCCRPCRCRSRTAACTPTDPALRGTALEYLEGVLPPDIRHRLWPFLGTSPPAEHRGAGSRRDPRRPVTLKRFHRDEPRGTPPPSRGRQLWPVATGRGPAGRPTTISAATRAASSDLRRTHH